MELFFFFFIILKQRISCKERKEVIILLSLHLPLAKTIRAKITLRVKSEATPVWCKVKRNAG